MQWIKRVFGEAARRQGATQDVQPTLIMALEPRMMFDGAAAATVAEASKPEAAPAKTDAGTGADSHVDGSATADKTTNHDSATDAPAAAATSDQRHEVVFIGNNVPGYQDLVASAKPGTEVVVLDSTRNGLQQMVDYLNGRQDIDAIHVLGHGNVGEVGLGNLVLSEANLATYQPLLAQLGRSLSADGDLLLYGCDVGSGAQGSAFVHDLATATGADVAASSNLTGSADKGGDWTLEVRSGSIEASTPGDFSHWEGLLDGGTLVAGDSTDVTKEININFGLEKLGNGNTAVAYLHQVDGDTITWDPSQPLYDGIVKVLDGGNNVIKTIDLLGDFGASSGYTVADASIKSLANGGFVVSWSRMDTTNYASTVYYAIYDNSGTLKSSAALATAGYGTSIAAQSNGDFAIAFQTTDGSQKEAINVFAYNGSGFTARAQTLVGGNSTITGSDADTNYLKFQLTPGTLAALSDGTYVLSSDTYDWVSPSYTPLGTFNFKIDANGALTNFASGKFWQRVNWDDSQSAPGYVVSFNGGYAVFGQKINSSYTTYTWQVTVYNNDGTLRTTTQQTDQVYNNGSTGPRTYYATDIATMDQTGHTELSYQGNQWKAQSATAFDDGTNLVFVFPDGSGGLKMVSISKTTGQLVGSATDSGITVPAGGLLFNPRYVSDGAGGYDITYSVLFDKDSSDGDRSGYAVGSIYQIGLDANPNPVVTDAHISITSTGSGTGGTYKVGDTITAKWDSSASGDNQSGLTGVTMDFSQFGGGSAVTATQVGGVWTASYTLTSGIIDAALRNVSVTATNALGSTTRGDSSNLSVDNQPPTVRDSNISISGGSGAGGSFKVGDTVTVTWNNTALGDNNTDTISSVKVDFSQFGGGSSVSASNTSGSWVATYVIASGVGLGTNRNVSVTATDNAGNSVTTADTSNATVANAAPTLSASGANPTFTENGSAVDLFNGVSVSTVESGQSISNLTLTVSNVGDGANETLSVDGTSVALTNGNSVVTTANGISVSVSVSGSTATVTIGKAGGISSSALQTLVDGLAYRNASEAPSAGGRVVTLTSLQDNGGTANGGADTTSLALASLVTVVSVNDAPTLSTTTSTPTFTENGSAVGLFSGTSISTVESGQAIQSVTLTVGNLANGANELLTVDGTSVALTNGNSVTTFSNGMSVSVSVSGSTATVTISKVAGFSASAAQTLINGLAYRNASEDPTGASRVITLTRVQDTGGTGNGGVDAASLALTSTVTLVAVNDAPTLIAAAANPLFIENDSAASLFAGTAISTVESGQSIQNLTLTVSNVANGASEILNIDGSDVALTNGNSLTTATNGMTVSVSLSGGTATITVTKALGISASAAQTLVNGLTYRNTSDAPSEAARVITLTSIQDNGGTANGGVDTTALGVSSIVNVFAVNDAPVVNINNGSVAFVAGDNVASTPVAVDSGLTISDADNTTLASATVSITGNFQAGEDVLSFTNNPATMGNIAGSYDAATGVLTLTSAGNLATLAQWQAALRSVTYTDTAITPINATRTISFVVNDGLTDSDAGTRTVTVTDTDQTPILTTSGIGNTFVKGGPPVVVDSGLTVSDLDNTRLASASVSITGNFHIAEDVLSFTNTSAALFGNISASYNSATGVMTLTSASATATLAQWQNALESVTYSNSSAAPNSATRTISFAVSDGTKTSVASTQTLDILVNPRVQDVSASSANGAYKVGDTVTVTVTFDQAVDVNTTGGTPTLLLETGLTDRSATYVSGSGTNTLTFTYTVQAGDQSADLDFTSASALSLNGSTLRSASGSDAVLTLAAPGTAHSLGANKAIVIDGVAPSVSSVAAPANGTYVAGQNLDFTVNFNEAVNVASGTPRLLVTVGSQQLYADYLSGSGTSALTFRLTVASGELDTDGVAVGSSLDLNGATVRDVAGNNAVTTLNSVASTAGVKVDAIVPTVGSVSVPANGTYVAGQNLDFTVNFSESVNVASGTPRLLVTVGSQQLYADYVSGSGSSALTFRLSVATGELDSDGVALGSSVQLNGATIRDAAGNNADLTLNSVASTSAVKVDAVAPSVNSVSVPADGSYKAGDTLSFTVNTDEAVLVNTAGGTPRLALTIGSSTVYANYVSGSGSNALVFSYQVQSGNNDADGITVGALQANGGTLRDAAGNDSVLTLNSVGSTASVLIDTTAPTVSSVSVPANGTYVAGQNLDFTVNFNEAVNVASGTPRLLVTVGSQQLYADYLSGSGSSALTFRLTVATGELDTDGVALGSALVLNGATVRDGAGNNAVTTLNSVASTAGVKIDAVVPTVGSVSVPANGTYVAGQNLDFTVNYSENVVLDTTGGVPRLQVTVGSQQLYANYVAGSGSSALTFRLTVATGELDTDGVALGSSVQLNGATIRDGAGNNADLTLSSVASTSAVKVDAVAPTVSSVSVPVDGSYKAGDTLSFTVNTDEAVLVDTTGGTPRLALTVGSSTVYANYVSGSGSNALVFSYQVQAGNTDADGITVGALQANGGTLRDAAGNDATLTLNSVGSTASVLVDTTVPTVSSVSVPADGTYVAGQNLDFTVNFSEAVAVDNGTPRLLVTVGSQQLYADYVSGSGSSALTFRLTVANGELDTDGVALGSALVLNGATIRDAAGNDASTTLNGVAATSAVKVDAVVPTVGSVDVPVNGVYAAGDVLTFTVNASEAVLVNTSGGTPRLVLDIGGRTVYANYVSGSGSTALQFQYQVRAGDNDANGIQVLGLQANGATLRDAAGNGAATTLASIRDTSRVLVDTTAPTASSIVRVDATPSNAGTANFDVRFSEKVDGLDAASFALQTTGSVSGQILSVTRLNDQTWRVSVGNLAGDGNLGIALRADSRVHDAAGNALQQGLQGQAYVLDHSSPQVAAVQLPADGRYSIGQTLQFSVDYSEAVVVDTSGGVPRIAITLAQGGTVYANYVSGSGTNQLVFAYTVQAGQNDNDGLQLSNQVLANGGRLTDAVGNAVNLALGNLPSTAGLLVQGSVGEGDPQHRAEQGQQQLAPSGSGTNSAPLPTIAALNGGLPVLGQAPLLDTRNVGQAQSNLSSLFRDGSAQSQFALVFSSSGSGSGNGIGNGGGLGFLGFGGGDGGVFASSTMSSVFVAAREGADEALNAFDRRGGSAFGELHGAFAATGLGQQLHEMNQREHRQVADLAQALSELGQAVPAS